MTRGPATTQPLPDTEVPYAPFAQAAFRPSSHILYLGRQEGSHRWLLRIIPQPGDPDYLAELETSQWDVISEPGIDTSALVIQCLFSGLGVESQQGSEAQLSHLVRETIATLELEGEIREAILSAAAIIEETGGCKGELAQSQQPPEVESQLALVPAEGPSLDRLDLPINPAVGGTLKAIYCGGRGPGWSNDTDGKPQFRHTADDGHLVLYFEESPGQESADPAIALWEVVRALSVETADTLLILLSKLANLPDPRKDLAQISLSEIADLREVATRHGRVWELHRDLKKEVEAIARLRISMHWEGYGTGEQVAFGREMPDRLLDIVGWELPGNRQGISYRAGQALGYFMNKKGIRWIGYYSQKLLALNPRTEALAKKIGTYWVFTGVIQGKKGRLPRARVSRLLDFCGEKPDFTRPKRTVDRLTDAHERLLEIGPLTNVSGLSPEDRGRGYLYRWLGQTVEVTLSPHLWQLNDKKTTHGGSKPTHGGSKPTYPGRN